MSIEAVNQFLEKVTQDNQLQEELTKAMEAEDDRQAVTDLANNKGYQFTVEELMAEIEKRQKALESGELSEEELESVAGGFVDLNALIIMNNDKKKKKSKW